MESFDVATLSRIQFALTIMFHYLFPPLSIGLGVLLVFMEGMYLATGRRLYESMAKFWARIFGLVFAIGVATGIVMEFQFGTNWAAFSRFVGDVFGSALAAEGIFAFFLESGFLAIVLFGWNRVSKKVHFFATVMVALGSMFSAIWIVVANSWQQTPAGYHLVQMGGQMGGRMRAEMTDFGAVLFNPSSLTRLTHVLLGAYILGSFFVMSVTAYYIIKKRHLEFARKAFTIALVWGALASLAQLISGHQSGQVVARYQPAKLAAFEGLYTTQPNAPIHLFGWPDSRQERVKYGLAVPGLLSLLAHNDASQPVTGLKEFPSADWPPVQITFQSYHLMVGLGMAFIALTWGALFLLWRRRLFNQTWLMWIFVFAVALPFVTNEAGWVAAEVGRQPWAVYGLLRTSDSFSSALRPEEVLFSLILFMAVYAMLFLLFLFVLDRKIRGGPEEPETVAPPEGPANPGSLIEAIGRRGKSECGRLDK